MREYAGRMHNHAPTAELQGDDLATWATLATLLEWLPPALDAQLRRTAELTHFEYGILFALADAPDRTLRMSVLAGYANSSLSRLSRTATRLESRGWLQRSLDPTDGRYTLATLTDDGAERYALASPGHAEAVRRLVLDPLTHAQARQLRVIAQQMLRAINDGGAWEPRPGDDSAD